MKKNTTYSVPNHVAVIMDGNRRWARERGLSVLSGHQKVANEVLEPLVEHAATRGVKYMTFWAFSTENWKRNASEVSGILQIFRHVIKKRWARLHEKGVRVKVIGDVSKFPDDIRNSLEHVVAQTKHNTKITAVFALNYGGRDEIVRAANKAISHQLSAIRQKKQTSTSQDRRSVLPVGRLTADDFSQLLDTVGIPDPDLIIRTSGEKRLSGFLPWQGAYSELYFPLFHMPDFTVERLDEALEEFAQRKRRFGT